MRPLGLIAGTLLVVALVFEARPVVAYETGSELLNACLVAERLKSQGAGSVEVAELAYVHGCFHFVSGVHWGLNLGAARALVQAGLPIAGVECSPDGATRGQIMRVVLKFLNEHPERLHENAALLVANAIVLAFPCQ